ncbi:hypothetical protein P691DRAFT_732999 [Macrolepiota fuliginosa MF-IS2]|uniref:Uncharacterized protein n=1 Tax=Macrolepiota fuliginosa MF-IS2 TaxID=1400762 RepID=A0A9P5X8G3_9AGAR|nr:hypothetical protein P691DRAFT_732999 [Macrolepiota fuliginosa MF-IS2]
MDSQVTLINYTTAQSSEGQVRLLYRRSDPRTAVLLEEGVPRYLLATSDDGLSKVKIRDMTQRMIAEVNQRMVLSDTVTLPARNDGKAMKMADILQKAPTTSDGQISVKLETQEGTYHWRMRRAHCWALYTDSPVPIAWTEIVSGSSPTWMLVVQPRALTLLDYVLASLFYLKAESVRTGAGDGRENMDARVASLLSR